MIEELFTCKLVDRLCTKPLVQFCHKIYDADDIDPAMVTLLETVLLRKPEDGEDSDKLQGSSESPKSTPFETGSGDNLTPMEKTEAKIRELKLEVRIECRVPKKHQ